jgi:propanol-preferring alcohol dehydrogenase
MARPELMRAMVLERPGEPLKPARLPVPAPGPGELLLKVLACGICRTDLHVVDGELTGPRLPLVPGHQIVALVEHVGAGVTEFRPGDPVGVPWLGGACGECRYCREGRENLCDEPLFTGYQKDGGFAEYCTADARFCFSLPGGFPAVQAAPLLCAGLIGYRSLRMAGEGRRIGIYGFGAAAHIVTQVAVWQGREVYAFTREGDGAGQRFAREMGASWAGGGSDRPPVELDSAIIFAPAGELVPEALKSVRKGGIVVCGGIHMSPIPSFPYDILWGERSIVSVANLTRRDGEEFLALAPQVPVRTEVELFRLEQANEALDALRSGRIRGAAVLALPDSGCEPASGIL